MRLFKRSKPQPAPVDPATLAGAHQLGLDGGTGMVARHNAFTDPDAGGRVDLLGHFVVAPSGQLDAPRVPDSWYADRPLYGGVRTAPAFGEFIADPGMTGGYDVMAGRRPFVFAPQMEPEQNTPVAVVREPPIPSMCRAVPSVGGGA